MSVYILYVFLERTAWVIRNWGMLYCTAMRGHSSDKKPGNCAPFEPTAGLNCKLSKGMQLSWNSRRSLPYSWFYTVTQCAVYRGTGS